MLGVTSCVFNALFRYYSKMTTKIIDIPYFRLCVNNLLVYMFIIKRDSLVIIRSTDH